MSINAAIGITPAAIGRPARLRADRIRRDTLTMLAAALAEDDDNHLTNALHRLVDAVKHDAPGDEVTELVADIEDLADMGRAAVDLTPGDVGQLAEQAWAALPPAPMDAPTAPQALPEWVQYTEPTGLPQRDRRAS